MNCTPKSPMQARTGCEKVKCTAFGTKTGPKTDLKLFFSDTMSMETTKLVAIGKFLLKAKVQCTCTNGQEIPKCCKFAASAK